MPRQSGEAAYDMLATVALRKHIYNTSSLRLPSTWCGSHPGRMERPLHGPAAHTSPRSNSKRREFATSVNVGSTPRKEGVSPTYWGATVTSLRQEPTWGDPDVLQKILPRLQPTNAAKLVAAFSSVHDRAKAVQLIRNGAAHNHAENMAEILLLQSAYVAFRISHPVQALYWVEPSSGDFLITHALDALKDAALVAIS